MKGLFALALIFLVTAANACSAVVYVWIARAPSPDVAIVGVVTEEYNLGLWSRSIRVAPKIALRGTLDENVIDVDLSCGPKSPRMGERATVAKLGRDWVLVPAWQEAEFMDFLLGLSGEKDAQ